MLIQFCSTHWLSYNICFLLSLNWFDSTQKQVKTLDFRLQMQTASRAKQYLQTKCSQLAFSKKQQIRWTLLIETRCEVGRKFSNSTVCLMGRTAKWQSDASHIVAEEKQYEQLCSNRFYMEESSEGKLICSFITKPTSEVCEATWFWKQGLQTDAV